jgi:hypothetical protein
MLESPYWTHLIHIFPDRQLNCKRRLPETTITGYFTSGKSKELGALCRPKLPSFVSVNDNSTFVDA